MFRRQSLNFLNTLIQYLNKDYIQMEPPQVFTDVHYLHEVGIKR